MAMAMAGGRQDVKGADTSCSHFGRIIIMVEGDLPNLSEPVCPSGKALGW